MLTSRTTASRSSLIVDLHRKPIRTQIATTITAMSASNNSERRQKIKSMADEIALKFPDVQTLSPAAVATLLAEEPSGGTQRPIVLVDARSADEYNVSMIPNSITKEEFEAKEEEFKAQNARVVCYCTIGFRSSKYATQLKERGFTDASNIEGSILAWTHDDDGKYRLINRATQTPADKVHVCSDTYELQADTYQPVKFKHGMASYLWSSITRFFS